MTIARAIAERSQALAAARDAERDRAAERRRLEDMEALIETVETMNLQAMRKVPSEVLTDVADLARRIAVPAPSAIWSARTGARLHEALLLWQGTLLDALRPKRLEYADRFD